MAFLYTCTVGRVYSGQQACAAQYVRQQTFGATGGVQHYEDGGVQGGWQTSYEPLYGLNASGGSADHNQIAMHSGFLPPCRCDA